MKTENADGFVYPRIPTIDSGELLTFLMARKPPVTEPELLKRFVPGATELMSAGMSAALYRVHFTLYHHLYRLAGTLESTGYRLLVNLIYVSLIKIPDGSVCLRPNDSANGFCGAPVRYGTRLCPAHYERERRLSAEGAVGFPDIAGFYLDPDNYTAFEAEKLERYSREIYFYAAHYREIDESLAILDLPPDYTQERLRHRYRYLSRKFHPDVASASGPVPFSRITGAYNLLLRLRS